MLAGSRPGHPVLGLRPCRQDIQRFQTQRGLKNGWVSCEGVAEDELASRRAISRIGTLQGAGTFYTWNQPGQKPRSKRKRDMGP